MTFYEENSPSKCGTNCASPVRLKTDFPVSPSRPAMRMYWTSTKSTAIREIIDIRIYLPLWPDESGEIYTAESGIRFHHFSGACHSIVDTKTCYLTPRFASECLLSTPHAQHFICLVTMPKWHHIIDNQQCKTTMTVPDHKKGSKSSA
jgi:hypothetical protein